MKKIIAFLLMISLSASFISCSTKEDIETDNSERFKVLEVGDYDYVSGAEHSCEISYNTEFYKKTDIEQNKKIGFNGIDYQMEYIETRETYLYNGNADFYINKEGNTIIQIGTNCSTGNVEWYSWYDLDHYKSSDKEKLTKSKCREIATEYVKQFLDISEYELTSESDLPSKEDGYVSYLFIFTRIIEGIETCDSAFIRITEYGDISLLNFVSLGSMKDAKLPSESDMKTIEENVEKKLQDIYDNVSDKYSISYEIPKPTFIRMHDGRYAFEYSVGVELTLKEGDDARPFSELTQLIVYVD